MNFHPDDYWDQILSIHSKKSSTRNIQLESKRILNSHRKKISVDLNDINNIISPKINYNYINPIMINKNISDLVNCGKSTLSKLSKNNQMRWKQ